MLFERIKARVGAQLLSTRPQFRPALQEVRKHLGALEEVPVLSLGPPLGGGAWQLADFRDLQADTRERHFERRLADLAKSIQGVRPSLIMACMQSKRHCAG